MKVLIIDDDPTSRECLSELLRSRGHEPAEAASAGEGLPMLLYCDAAIVDGLGGACWVVLEPCKEHGIPAVLFSGHRELVRAALAEGTPAVLKPNYNDLLAAIGQAAGVGR